MSEIWGYWDTYFENIKISNKNGRYQIDCIKGLWGVDCPTLKEAIRESSRYFLQYASDGEYDGTAKEKLWDKLTGVVE